MLRIRLALAAMLCGAAPALAQQSPALLGGNNPVSGQASNITPGDTTSTIAPALPAPALGEDAPPAAFLASARQSLAAGRTGEAQEALERAESRALSRSVRPSQANEPSKQPLVRQIAEARGALSAGDRLRALRLIEAAMRSAEAK